MSEQAEERTVREGRERAEAHLLDELGLSFHRVGNSLQVTLFDPFKIESLVPADKSYTAHFAMDKAWKRLIEKQAECSRLASRVEELEKLVAAGYENFHDGWDSTEWRERAMQVLSSDALPQANGKKQG